MDVGRSELRLVHPALKSRNSLALGPAYQRKRTSV
jgi:hypothetical protein